MKKTGILIIIVFFLVNTKVQAQELTGTWRYSTSSSKATVTGGKIENKNSSGKTGTLKLKLYASKRKYSGGSLNGYCLLSKRYEQLSANKYYYNIRINDSFSKPPSGRYYITLCLMEYKNGGYRIVDYRNFNSSTVNF